MNEMKLTCQCVQRYSWWRTHRLQSIFIISISNNKYKKEYKHVHSWSLPNTKIIKTLSICLILIRLWLLLISGLMVFNTVSSKAWYELEISLHINAKIVIKIWSAWYNVHNNNHMCHRLLHSLTPRKWIWACQTTAEEFLFEWLYHRISSTDSQVRTTYEIDSTMWKYWWRGFIWMVTQ